MTAAVNWLMGDENLDPPWRFGPEGERFEVEVTGDPGVFVTFKKLHPGEHRSGAAPQPGDRRHRHAPRERRAIRVSGRTRGSKTYLDLPLVAGRAAPDLGRGRGAMILDRFSVDRSGRDRHRCRTGHRSGHRDRTRRGGRRCRPRCADRSRTSTRWPEQVAARGRRALAVRDRRHRPRRARDVSWRAPCSEFGRLDILVNNAGGTMPRPGDGHV